MCPACIATGAWIVAGATSTGGLTAFVVSKLRRPKKPDEGLTSDEVAPNT
jgi:hypothetical protein